MRSKGGSKRSGANSPMMTSPSMKGDSKWEIREGYGGACWRGDRARAYNGPWGVIARNRVPRAVLYVPRDYRTKYEQGRRVPYGQWKKDRSRWDRENRKAHKQWEKEREKEWKRSEQEQRKDDKHGDRRDDRGGDHERRGRERFRRGAEATRSR